MQRILALTLIVALIGCGAQGDGWEPTDRLNVYNWTYYIPDDVVADFEKEFGVKVVYDQYTSNEEMYAKILSGGTGYDLTVPTQDYAEIMIAQGMLAPINFELIPNFQFVNPAIKAKNTYDPDFKFTVPYMIGVAGVAIDTSRVPNFEKSWNVFENPAIRGKATLLDDPRQTIGSALMYLGFSPNTVDDGELNQALEVLQRWKRNILRFDSESQGKGFASGEFWVVHSYAENVLTELDAAKRANTVFFIPKEGAPMYLDSFVILKDAPNKLNAHKFVNFIHRPDIYARICKALGYPSINTEADKILALDSEFKPNYSIEDLQTSILYLDVGENLEKYNRIWQQLRGGN